MFGELGSIASPHIVSFQVLAEMIDAPQESVPTKQPRSVRRKSRVRAGG
jgi:hypothetical protein